MRTHGVRRPLLLFTGMLGLAVLELQAEGMPPRAELLQQMAHAHSAALREAVFVDDHWPNPPTRETPVRAPGQNPNKPRGGGNWTDPDLQTLASGTSLPGTVHFEGIRANGVRRYFRSWIPDVPKAILPLIVPLEILGQFMRLISLSVRLYANMLAGHMLILTFLGLIFIIGNVALAAIAVPAATAFYLFEVVIVVSIQAYIFAALSAIYIGSAIEPEH